MVKKFSLLLVFGIAFALLVMSTVSASHRFLYYDSLLRRSDYYDIVWQGPYQGGNLFVSISGSGNNGYNYYNPFYYTTTTSNPADVGMRHRYSYSQAPSYSQSYNSLYPRYGGYVSTRFGGR